MSVDRKALIIPAAVLGFVIVFVSAAASSSTDVQGFVAPVEQVTAVSTTSTNYVGSAQPTGHIVVPRSTSANVNYLQAPVEHITTAAHQRPQGSFYFQRATALAALLSAVGAAAYLFVSRKSSDSELPLLPLLNNNIALAATTGEKSTMGRREALATAGLAWGAAVQPSLAGGLADDPLPPAIFCDDECEAALAKKPRIKTASGLEYQIIEEGTGVLAPVGYQVTFHLIAKLQSNGKTFINTLDKGKPLDARVGANSIVAGLDEALSLMPEGSLWRVYVPPELSYPQGLKAAPGTPAVPARSPVIFDVALLLVPGLEKEEQDGGNEFTGLFE